MVTYIRTGSGRANPEVWTQPHVREHISDNHLRRFDIIPLLVDVAQGAAKEKVIRVIVATFRVSAIVPLRH